MQRRELSVSIEDIELAIVLAEGRSGVSAARIVDCLNRALALADDQRLQDTDQLVAIGREVLEHIDRSALISQNRHQVDLRHLRAKKLLRCRQSPQLVGRAHGRHVEVERQETSVLVPFGRSTAVSGLRGNLRAGKPLVELQLFVA